MKKLTKLDAKAKKERCWIKLKLSKKGKKIEAQQPKQVSDLVRAPAEPSIYSPLLLLVCLLNSEIQTPTCGPILSLLLPNVSSFIAQCDLELSRPAVQSFPSSLILFHVGPVYYVTSMSHFHMPIFFLASSLVTSFI